MDSQIQKFTRALELGLKGKSLSKSCSKGVFVFREGDPYLGPWVLKKGAVVLVKGSASGKEQILRQVEPGEIFAEVPVFCEVPWYPVNARCTETSELILLPLLEVRNVLQRESRLAWLAARAMAERIAEFRDMVVDLTLTETHQRILRYLVRRMERGDGRLTGVVRLGMPQQDLALLLGIRPESLSRALSELEKEKKIQRLTRQSFQLFRNRLKASDLDV